MRLNDAVPLNGRFHGLFPYRHYFPAIPGIRIGANEPCVNVRDVVPRVPECPHELFIHILYLSALIADRDRHRRLLGQPPEMLFAFSQRLVGPFAIGNVDSHPDKARLSFDLYYPARIVIGLVLAALCYELGLRICRPFFKGLPDLLPDQCFVRTR